MTDLDLALYHLELSSAGSSPDFSRRLDHGSFVGSCQTSGEDCFCRRRQRFTAGFKREAHRHCFEATGAPHQSPTMKKLTEG